MDSESLFSTASVFESLRRRLTKRSMACLELCWPAPMRAIGAQNLLTMPGGVSICGYLHKKGGSQLSLLKWPLRYIILHKGCVYYFKTSTSPAPQGAFSLNGYNRVMRATEETTSSNVFPFKIVHFSKKHRTWVFSAASEEERRKWMRWLRKEIDHYNERRDSNISIDTDSESFYGSIERTMDIKPSEEHTEDDYMEEDDDEDDEDYVKPDSSPISTGCSTVHPPAYPPPPVPATPRPLTSDHCSKFCIGPTHPPPVPPPNKLSPRPPLRKTPPAFPPPPLHKDLGRKFPLPPPPPPNTKRLHQGQGTLGDAGPGSMTINRPLSSRPAPSPNNSPRGPPGNQGAGCSKPSPPLPPPPSPTSSPSSYHPARPAPPTHPPQPRTGNSRHRPHPPPTPATPTWTLATPTWTPATPTQTLVTPTRTPPRPTLAEAALQRASPEGQSFRMSVDKMQEPGRRKPGLHQTKDDDYEDVQLPDSIFIDTTETSSVEKLFKEVSSPPPDGLYGIRNSGTKTSKVLVVWDVSVGKARNYRLFEEDQRVFLDMEVPFLSLEALIEHYYTHPLPHHGSLCLQTPYMGTHTLGDLRPLNLCQPLVDLNFHL